MSGNSYTLPAVDKPTLDPALQQSLRHTTQDMPSQVLFLINDRKFLLSRVYDCLQSIMGADRRVRVRDVNSLAPGTFTNPRCRGFVETDHVVMILTKNHNLKQQRILRELQMNGTPVTLITLGCRHRIMSRGTIYQVPTVRSLYHLMYNLCSMQKPVTPGAFLHRFTIIEPTPA